MLTINKIKQMLQLLEENYRHTSTDLNYDTPFQLLISTMLAAQSTEKWKK